MKITKKDLRKIIKEEIEKLNEIGNIDHVFVRLTYEEFINNVTAEYGWAVGEQAEDILKGESFNEQNSNALTYIKNCAEKHGEYNIAALLDRYLKKGDVNSIHDIESVL